VARDKIQITGLRKHSKASEMYVDVVFTYEEGKQWKGSVPIHYRRTGVFAETEEQIKAVVEAAYKAMVPSEEGKWLSEEESFWDASNKGVTRSFFEGLKDCRWKCVACELPKNPNWARRVQDIKELGYTLATNTKMFCSKCGRNTTHLIMLRLPRGGSELGYETLSPVLRKRIFKTLNNFDAYENRQSSSYSLLPDHKFPEIRWDESVRQKNPDDMPVQKIQRKFQLMSNQRNQQKREVCRYCFQTGNRGTPFGISYFYEGGPMWPTKVPRIGVEAEKGCKGCGWYDLESWRKSLNEKLGSG